MSFLKRLFGGGGSAKGPDAPAAEAEHKGHLIKATPYEEAGQWQTCGVITREVDGEVKEHRFIRADRFPSREAAADQAILKGKQIIDQNGDRVFQL
ncbi:MAG: HlyU family transcriptional regulator [Mesorhizobium sp.]